MADRIPYDTSSDALLHPAKNAVFFKGWDPAVDNGNHDLLCAEMSRLAYAQEKDIRDSLQRIGFTSLELIGGEGEKERAGARGTQGFVASNPEGRLTVLAFRGTESDKFEDLLADARTLQKKWPSAEECLVHAGFVDCLDCVRDRVTELLVDHEETLLITGHSLGAALATLAAIDAKPAKLITFGSPLVGNEKLGALLQGHKKTEVRRYVNCCDLIARVPPERFDQDHVSRLLTELACLERLGAFRAFFARWAIRSAATAIALAFGGLGLDPRFKHVAPAFYGDRNGEITHDIADDIRLADQAAARRAYAQPTTLQSIKALGKRFKELRTMRRAKGHGEALQILRTFMAQLFAPGDRPAPFRDLADHSPINYVSLFTGRESPTRGSEAS